MIEELPVAVLGVCRRGDVLVSTDQSPPSSTEGQCWSEHGAIAGARPGSGSGQPS
jgi:hypothetical protein